MKITTDMINKELRFRGKIISVLLHTFTEKKLRILGKTTQFIRIHPLNKNIKLRKKWISRKDGSKMRLCIFESASLSKNPKSRQNRPGILWLHGGGYALGFPEQAMFYAEKFIKEKNCVIVAPDYCLSTTKPYPAALKDAYLTLLWMKNNKNKLGINDSQIIVGGDSAGGGLAAALSLYARDKNEIKIAFQMPLYPMLDDRMITASSQSNNAPVWNSESNYNGWKLYLADLFSMADVPSYAAAARATTYNNLPPTITFVGDLEPFRDETIKYVENLKSAGINVEFKLFKGCFHAFDQICPNAQISKQAHDFLIKSFSFAVENYRASQ